MVHVRCLHRSLDAEYRAVLAEKSNSFEYLQMPTVASLAGNSLEEAMSSARQAKEAAQKQALISTWQTFTSGA